MKKINWEEMANYLLDSLIDVTSIEEVARTLFDAGYSPETLEYLGFDDETIAELIAEEEAKVDDTMDRDYQAMKDDRE